MAGYSVQIKNSALKALRRIDKPNRARLISAIDRLAVDPGRRAHAEVTLGG
jgi:mRNA-degrading endonuclease RelE of RelBE toxin-antitoxin system